MLYAESLGELTHWKRPWCWEGLGAGGEGDDRGWDGWMASPTQWTWAWVNSGSWWWRGRPGVLWFMGSQRVGHAWATELNWRQSNVEIKVLFSSLRDSDSFILLKGPRLPCSLAGKESACNVGDLGSMITWRRQRTPSPVFWPGEFPYLMGSQRVGHVWATFTPLHFKD